MYRHGGEEEEEDEERRRQRKLEEALEIKSLRRIISAYLNYPDAADEDVRRYERSFKKLPPAHKALLSHYPLKFKKLRKCISENSYFIFNMLQAFEPPLDMSQDVDCCEHSHGDCCDHSHSEDASNNHHFHGERDACACQPAETGGGTCCSKPDQVSCMEANNVTNDVCDKTKELTDGEGLQAKGVHGSITTSCPSNTELNQETNIPCCDDIDCSNGHVSSPNHHSSEPSMQFNVPLVDVDKVRCIIRNIVRDWAEEGKKEREQCYKPILEELNILFPNRSKESPPTCLVPGAGLGRLALEISCLGFVSQGNEFSYYMMICSSFILNQAQTAGEWTIYPWIHSNCNSLSDNDQLRPVSIPDIHPASTGITEGFSMCGGDFVEVYSDPSHVGAWDAVVTSFFIDTAHNIVEYIEIISKILKDGGVWINLGPLLYHFADTYGQDEMSVELSLEDVKRVALQYGFQIEKEKTIETTYTTNPKSMMQNRYYAVFWTMRKKPSTSPENQVAGTNKTTEVTN